jgi:hypothetical protein
MAVARLRRRNYGDGGGRSPVGLRYLFGQKTGFNASCG